jgi:hypothetical protein
MSSLLFMYRPVTRQVLVAWKSMRSISSRRFGLSGSWLVKFRPLPPEKFACGKISVRPGRRIEPVRGNPAETPPS